MTLPSNCSNNVCGATDHRITYCMVHPYSGILPSCSINGFLLILPKYPTLLTLWGRLAPLEALSLCPVGLAPLATSWSPPLLLVRVLPSTGAASGLLLCILCSSPSSGNSRAPAVFPAASKTWGGWTGARRNRTWLTDFS